MSAPWLRALGRWGLGKLRALGRSSILLCHALIGRPQPGRQFPLLIKQIYFVGVQSVIIILVSGLFIGMVLGLQGFNILKSFMATGALGTMVALAIIRELGPVVTALLFAGRAGSALTAELGQLKASEQLAALETWNSNLGDGEYTAPGAIQYSTEEAEAYAALFADISTYATQCSLSFLTGDMSLEDDWDTYLANLEQLGLSDWLEVCQSAYDRYSERVAEAVSE